VTSTLLIQDNTGDTRIEWDKNNATEVELARKNFDEHKAKRYDEPLVGRLAAQARL
jgi:hypothetical protein